MKTLDWSTLMSIVSGAVEARNIEFKPGFIWNDAGSKKIQEETIKAVLAMSNTPNGGDIVLGISTDTKNKKVTLDGVDNKCVNSFEKLYEEVEKMVGRFGSQEIVFTIYLSEGEIEGKPKKFIIFRVSEFGLYPIVCKEHGSVREDGGKFFVLEEGFIYTRPKKAPWSSRKASSEEVEEIVRLSVDKYRQDLKLRGYVKLDSLVVKLKEERSDYE